MMTGQQTMLNSDGRQVLRDISGLTVFGRGLHPDANMPFSPLELYSPSASLDEHVIHSRSRKHRLDQLSLSFNDLDSDDDSIGFLQLTPNNERSASDYCRKKLRMSLTEDMVNSSLHDRNLLVDESLVPLQTELQAYSTKQLARTIGHLVTSHPQLEVEVRQSLSAPDLGPMEERLAYLKRAVYRAFPSFRLVSSRDSYSYRRVRVPIDIFKKTCIDQARILASSRCWDVVVQYVLMAWNYVHQLPSFEDPAHNRPRRSCFRYLTVQCLAALKNGLFTRDQLQELRGRLVHCYRLNSVIEPCIRQLEKMLQEAGDSGNCPSSNCQSSVVKL